MSLVAWTRLVRYQAEDGSIRYGEPIVDDKHDVAKLAWDGQLKVHVCEGADPLSAKPTDQVETVAKLLGPLEPKNVPIIRCIGLNYKAHILEGGRSLPACPTIFTKPSPAVADHDAPVPIPGIAQQYCDYEGELVVLIGKDAKNVQAENALDYVAAYTCGNDVSTRDWQREPDKAGPVPQWSFSKSFDKYAPLGPCLVAQKLLGAADAQELRTRVNGEERQSANTSDLCFDVKKLIAFASQGQTLQKGSLVMTGTPGGVGFYMKPQNMLKDGDEVEVEISGIGTLRNKMSWE